MAPPTRLARLAIACALVVSAAAYDAPSTPCVEIGRDVHGKPVRIPLAGLGTGG